jgi:hypothetical protein
VFDDTRVWQVFFLTWVFYSKNRSPASKLYPGCVFIEADRFRTRFSNAIALHPCAAILNLEDVIPI